MAVVIRLQRMGKPKQPYFRLVAIEKARGPRGRALEILGSYNPRIAGTKDKMQVDVARVQHWIGKGAKPSETCAHLLKPHLPAAVKAEAKGKHAAGGEKK